MKIVLDTTALIHILKKDENLIKKIQEIKDRSILHTTSINIYEIMRGMKLLRKDKEIHLNALNVLMTNLNIVQFDSDAAEKASSVYADLRKKGITIDPADYMIVGCCLSNDINAIITKNEKHFKEIEELQVINY